MSKYLEPWSTYGVTEEPSETSNTTKIAAVLGALAGTAALAWWLRPAEGFAGGYGAKKSAGAAGHHVPPSAHSPDWHTGYAAGYRLCEENHKLGPFAGSTGPGPTPPTSYPSPTYHAGHAAGYRDCEEHYGVGMFAAQKSSGRPIASYHGLTGMGKA